MDLRRYSRTVLRWKWLILSISVITGITAVLVSLQLPRVYSSMSNALVSPKQIINPGNITNPNQLPSNDQLVDTYAVLINTAPVREELVREGVPRTAEEMKSEITAYRAPNVALVVVTVQDKDPAVARQIAVGIIPAFNKSLTQLQAQVPGTDENSRLQALVPWDLPTDQPAPLVSPNIPFNAGAAVLGGLVLALVLAFVLEGLDNTLRTESDVRLRLGQQLLGSVYVVGEAQGARGALTDVALLTAKYPKDPVSEQYRALRTNIMFSAMDSPLRSIVVTSTLPSEGKTTVASNLSIVMAQAGHRVILIDADFRRPTVHKVFGLRPRFGLGNLVLGDQPESSVILDSGYTNLRLICSGPTPPNPSEVLGSSNMERLLQRLGTNADMVILDTPPVSAVTDSTVLGTLTDGTILVVERGRAGTPSISRAIDTFQTVGVRLLGVVLNKAVPSEGTEYYYYSYDDSESATVELPMQGKEKSNQGTFEPSDAAVVADQS